MAERLRAAIPGVTALEGSAEVIPLLDGSADAVLAAQSYHWFDKLVALPEIARVLRPHGTLGLVWNMRVDDEPWLERLAQIVGSEQISHHEPTLSIEASRLFGAIETATFEHEQRLDRGALLDLVASRSGVATSSPDVRESILVAVGDLYDESAGPGGLVMPYVAHTFRARKA